ncbi:strigolactone esterase D14-like [Malania oleifera]|uniref:strigolactone esterase D14-like n=1 Tax=Malania oleifera TaxID=397392 RepID=UPI0025AE9A82|nr:strigolactone esterase D14-like [Malania oleifera]
MEMSTAAASGEVCYGGGESNINLVEALNPKVYGNGSMDLDLAHGFGADQGVWHLLLPYLTVWFRVVVFDLAFSGNVNPKLYDPTKYSSLDSYARDLLSLLDHLGVKKTLYVGHSMSAMIGCLAAAQRPQLFEHLILLCGSPRYLNEEGYNGGLERYQVDAILNQIDQNFTSWVPTFAPKVVGVNDESAIREFELSLRRMKPETTLSVAKTVFLSDLRDVLPKVRVPNCTIIQSKMDLVVPKSVAFYIKEKLGDGNAVVEMLETEGHLPQLTAHLSLLEVLKKVLHLY